LAVAAASSAVMIFWSRNPLQHVRAALQGPVGMADGGEVLRRLDEPREQRPLRQAEVLRALREEELRRCLDAVAPVSEIDLVAVEGEDLLLVYSRSICTASIASWTLRDIVLSGLRKRLRASCWVMVLPPWPNLRLRALEKNGARDAERVDAEVAVEVLVLSGDDTVDEALRDVLVLDDDALLFARCGSGRVHRTHRAW
jgi:hypothetical protein